LTDTIYALSSGAGRAAIAVVRISGPLARATLAALAGKMPPPRLARLAVLRGEAGDILDRALILFFEGPYSDTGEDIAELHLHGSRAVVKAVLEELARRPGLRVAQPGEFARRALVNGKRDLLDIEALGDLVDAETEMQRRQALQGGGSLLRGKAEAWRNSLLRIRADLEAGIDFSDEGDVISHLDSEVERILDQLLIEMNRALELALRGERVREGFAVALCGAPNAGKSSLLNALAGRDVAIVSSTPGTTRDRIEVALEVGGWPIRVVDTAGIRDSADAIEREGMRRALDAAQEAGLVLWLSAIDDPQPPPPEFEGAVVVDTKIDLCSSWHGSLGVSTTTDVGIGRLIEWIGMQAAEGQNAEPVLLTRARHVATVREAARALRKAQAFVRTPEICAEFIRQAERGLDQLLGRIDVEDVLGEIFSRFCIGK
jgi:tRNA modification GTPase